MNQRDQARQQWLTQHLDAFEPPTLLAGDASFRRYYRLRANNHSYVLMDAPPAQESCGAFVAVDRTFQSLGLLVPTIYYADVEQGFLLLSDFGDHQLLGRLNERTVDTFYKKACESILVIQRCREIDDYDLPLFDETLYR